MIGDYLLIDLYIISSEGTYIYLMGGNMKEKAIILIGIMLSCKHLSLGMGGGELLFISPTN